MKFMMNTVNENKPRALEVLLRMLALVATLIAIIVMGLSKETELIAVTVLPNLPPLNVHINAKWQYSPAFVYFFVANMVACAYALVSLVLLLVKLVRINMTIIALDLIIAALLFSSDGATFAIGYLGYKGNVHTGWTKICNKFPKYCRFITASVIMSLIGAIIFLIMVMLTASRLHKSKV